MNRIRRLVRIAALAALAASSLLAAGQADPPGRAEQLQGLSGVSRALQEGHGARASRRSTPRAACSADRSKSCRATTTAIPAMRCASPRSCSPARRSCLLMGTFRVERRPRRGRPREAAQGAVPRRGAAHRQDRLGERQPLHVPAARLDLHADRDAGSRGGEARGRSAGRSSIPTTSTASRRPRAFKQQMIALQASGIEFVEQAVPLGKIDAGPVVQALARRQARRHLLVVVRRRSRALRPRRRIARPLQGPSGVQPSGRRAGIPRSVEGRGAGRMVGHRLSLVRHRDRRAQALSRRVPVRSSTTIRGSAPSSATAR